MVLSRETCVHFYSYSKFNILRGTLLLLLDLDHYISESWSLADFELISYPKFLSGIC